MKEHFLGKSKVGEDEILLVKSCWDYEIYRGDSLRVLRTFGDSTFDSTVLDPPSGIAFMGKDWDKDKGGYEGWVAWLKEILIELKRVLKPGAHGLVWALPRTSHWTGRAIEESGFEIRDKIFHAFSTGFPKSHNISKGIDRVLGAKRKVVGFGSSGRNRNVLNASDYPDSFGGTFSITSSKSKEAKEWDGWGTALKPSLEEWFLIRKIPEEKNIALNVMKYGTGGLNIDGSRVSHQEECKSMKAQSEEALHNPKLQQGGRHEDVLELKPEGRWPAHFVMSHSPECRKVGERKVKGSSSEPKDYVPNNKNQVYGNGMGGGNRSGFADAEGLETIDSWECVDGCPVLLMDQQSGESVSVKNKDSDNRKNKGDSMFLDGVRRPDMNYQDKGTASRFFKQFEVKEEDFPPFVYCAKPSTSEKERGLKGETKTVDDGRNKPIDNAYQRGKTERLNTHPTVKPIALMAYFCKLITPPGGRVIDPFSGSFTTGVGAIMEGFRFTGIDLSEEYTSIGEERLSRAITDRRSINSAKQGATTKEKEKASKKGFGKFKKLKRK